MIRKLATLIGAALALTATPAFADAPEQLYERGPSAGHFAIEYNGQAGDGDPFERPHSLEAFAGISDRLAIGVEVEGEVEDGRFRTDEYAIGALIGLNDEDAPVALTVLVQAGINRDGDFPQAQARLIAQHEGEEWEWNGNVIARREKGEDSGSALAYAASVHRRVSKTIAVGVEASGQIARLSGFSGGFDEAQYAGPSLMLEFGEEDETGFELGVKYLRRIDSGAAYEDTLRLTVGLRF